MTPYRAAAPPPRVWLPRPRLFRPLRSISVLLSLPLATATFMFFGILVAFALQASIVMAFRLPSGCLCGVYDWDAPAGVGRLVVFVDVDEADDGGSPDGGARSSPDEEPR